jgi:uncharacterized protein (TIGR02217 family)
MSSTWPVFPICPAFGFTSAPDYSVTIVERSGGVRSVNRNWYYPLHTYSAVPIGDRDEQDIYRIQKFWHAIGGRSGRFLFDDGTDNHTGDTPETATTRSDQPVMLDANDSPPQWQLFKLYEDDTVVPGFQQLRIIQKPRAVLLAINDVPIVEGVAYTIDYDTGIVTFSVEPESSDAVTWGGTFYVPVMFETRPEFVLSNRKIRQTGFTLQELRLPRSS